MRLLEDTILENRYRIDRLAHGGMGAIYREYDTKLDVPVASRKIFFKHHRISANLSRKRGDLKEYL